MNIFLLTLIYAIFVFNANICFSHGTSTPVIRTQQGLVNGITEKSLNGREFYSYMGIPFAEPPIGSLRFKDPVPVSSWESTLNATTYPSSCLQNDFFDLAVEDKSKLIPAGVEDCLYLNVFTHKPTEVKHPVMVFIHGGGFVCGASDLYQPYILLNEDVILVTIQYRLGIFGFLSTEDSVLPGNMGLKDQQLALKWIKKNIHSFGGDPDRITIFGESAGGASVHYQILSPNSKGLFQRAILQSGTAFCPWAQTSQHRKFAQEAGSEFGCSFGKGYLQCMQKADAHKLLQLATGTAEWSVAPLFALPRVDGEFLTDYPEILVKEGKYNKVDIMTGITRDEGALSMLMFHINSMMLPRLHTNFEKYGPLSLYLHRETNGVEMSQKIYDYYLSGAGVSSTTLYDENLMELYSDIFFGVCHDNLVRFLAKDRDVSLYLYQLDHFGEFSIYDAFPQFDRNNWVGHTEELNYLFHGGHFFSNKITREDDVQIGAIILALWTNFAKTGNPTPNQYPIKWEKATGDEFRKLSLKLDLKMETYDFNEKRELWGSLKTKSNEMLGIYKEKHYYDIYRTDL